jgi:hypothetical protein
LTRENILKLVRQTPRPVSLGIDTSTLHKMKLMACVLYYVDTESLERRHIVLPHRELFDASAEGISERVVQLAADVGLDLQNVQCVVSDSASVFSDSPNSVSGHLARAAWGLMPETIMCGPFAV